jgi:hypothetical protein
MPAAQGEEAAMATMTMSPPLGVPSVAGLAPAPSRRRRVVTSVTGAPRRSTVTRPVRLTRRGRLLLVAALALAAFAGLSMGRGAAPAATDVTAGPATARIVVAPGSTLWSIASDAAPNADPRETIVRIRELNPGLATAPGGTLVAGQPLIVPAR